MKRIIYVDLLRITATFSVVLLHVAAGNWSNAALGTFEWNVFNFYDSMVRFGVPIFVMISGMFLLNPDKNISYRDIYSKYIPRVAIAFIVWSFLYALYTNVSNYYTFNQEVFIRSFVFGHYHLWYLYMITGLYIVTPILRKIAEDKEATEYFIFLSVIITSVLPIIIKVFNLVDLDLFVKKFHLPFTFGYAGYYIGGYYLGRYEISKSCRNILYISGVLGVICTYTFTNIISMRAGKADSTFYSYFAPNVATASIALFLFFKYEVSKIRFNKNTVKIISMLSDSSFGIYLIHDFFIMLMLKAGIDTLNYNVVLSVPLVAVTIFAASFAASFIIGKIPLLKRMV
ncbi:MAG TPA: hypothetical protein DEF04_09755 [Clostridiales bacterium]|nr:hypothetical protein [Clostridiales bacterium]